MTGLPVRTAPLSYLQEQLWFVEQDDPGNGSYNELKVLVLDGTLDAARLGRALERVVARHDVLRTTFVYQGAEPVQAVWDRGPVLREAAVGGEQALMEYAREVAEAPYDLASGPLLLRLARHARRRPAGARARGPPHHQRRVLDEPAAGRAGRRLPGRTPRRVPERVLR
ncbi:condensation domain-containing protein [Streptosporangium vulgare]|uniref:condensation domain-containing protein n=1 Tax=Streptosporangium vulgare TaxID=46190 RepID=UPI0031E28347